MKKVATVIAGLAVCTAAVVGWMRWVRDTDEANAGGRAAATLAAGLDRAMAAALALQEPYRCARLGDASDSQAPDTGEATDSQAPGTGELGGFVMRKPGHRLEIDRAARPRDALRLGVVADARGIVRHVAAVRREFEARDVDMVVSLGGLGQTRAEIAAVLEALTGPWPLIAMPGDREAMPAHRAATAALANRGVVDGSRTRLITMDHVTLATLPGSPRSERLMAGTEGCVHTREDVSALVKALADTPSSDSATPRMRVLLSHVPPRQRGPRGTDRSAGGIHLGEIELAETLAEAGVDVAIHGLVASAGPGEHAPGKGSPRVLSAGALDGIVDVSPGGGSSPLALVVTLEPGRGKPAGKVRWEAIQK